MDFAGLVEQAAATAADRAILAELGVVDVVSSLHDDHASHGDGHLVVVVYAGGFLLAHRSLCLSTHLRLHQLS